jgi:hypothetical protein
MDFMAEPKNHTHQTVAGVEDALAVLIDIALDLEALRLRTERAIEILKRVRSGPYAYDPEAPAGLRIVVKKKECIWL